MNYNMKMYYLFFIIYISYIISLSKLLYSNKLEEEYWINIFVHGTIGVRPNLNFNTVLKIIKNQIYGSEYENNIINIRNKELLFSLQPIQHIGLKKINKGKGYPKACYTFSLIFDYISKKFNNKKVKNRYYTFGWTGLLSYYKRIEEGKKFYKELKNELNKLKEKYKKDIKIRIIGYSHGGSVSLNIAHERDKNTNDDFKIDELILIGMPVQNSNAKLINHEIFKEVYHIYSNGDYIQILDCFSPCSFISGRRFCYNLSKKLTQIEIKIKGPFLKNPNVTLPQSARGYRNQSPGHFELWCFGWTKNGYRKNFIFYPLPVAVFIPYIIEKTKKFKSKYQKNQFINDILFDINPTKSKSFISCKRFNSPRISAEFLEYKELLDLQLKALKYHPGNKKYISSYIDLHKKCDQKVIDMISK